MANHALTVNRRFEPSTGSFEQSYLQHTFQIGKRFGDRWLSNVEVVRDLDQAAEVVERGQQLQVPRLEVSAQAPIESNHYRPPSALTVCLYLPSFYSLDS